MAPFYDMCVAYYQLVKAEDEILYPGYHVHLLDDASETYIYETREGLLKGLEFQESFLNSCVRDLVAVESQLAEIGLEPSQVLKVCVTTIILHASGGGEVPCYPSFCCQNICFNSLCLYFLSNTFCYLW